VTCDLTIARVKRVEARCTPALWAWAQANRAAIEANWAEKLARTPRMFNGRVLLLSGLDLAGEICRASYFEADFKDFLAWRDLGYPDPSIGNGYAMAALQGSDGAFVCGVMGRHTANAGRVYFPSGTPDLSDLLPDGTVDLATSVTRELAEETDLPADLFEVAEEWIVVRRWPAVAFMRPVRCREPAEAIAARIRAAIARQEDPELADAKVIRGPGDIDPATMPSSVQSFLRWSYGA
jgi:8-oxo-dGTP pyrophosphatase MutT (NUDIX family)